MPDLTVLGFDVGSHWIGVAVGQTATATASPLQAIAVRNNRPDWAGIQRHIDEWRPQRLIVGLPRKMDGEDTDMTRPVLRFSRQLEGRFQLPCELIDERLTTREAWQIVEQQAHSRLSKPDIDNIAAVLITETWLNSQVPQTG